MNVHEYRFLLADRAALKGLISETGPDEVITRRSFEYRLSQVEEELKAYEGYSPEVVEAELTFRGKPVSGSRGGSANFLPNVTKRFATAIHYIGASQKYVNLNPTGAVRDKKDYELMITDTALGSFGFRVEEASQQPSLLGELTPVERAIDGFKSILEASVGPDSQLAEAIGDVDSRAIKAVRDFLNDVAKEDEVCALEFKGDKFSFRDTSQVKRSRDRLDQDIVQEDEVEFLGRFQGFLPKSRRAEFLIEAVDDESFSEHVEEVITCPVVPSPNDARINSVLNLTVRATLRARRVGAARPRFVITDWRLAS